MACTMSGAAASWTELAPSASASSRLAGEMSDMAIRFAPCRRAAARVRSPMVPAPRMATDLPVKSGPASFTAWTGVDSGRGQLFLGVRGDQRGIQVNDQRPVRADLIVGGMLTGQLPHPFPNSSSGLVIAANAAVGVAANASTNLETVGSEATRPNTAGSARSNPMSARQSPAIATLIAKSSRILPASSTAHCFRHGDNAADNARSNPIFPAVATRTPHRPERPPASRSCPLSTTDTNR